jgi:hypothetical protein
VDGQIRAKHLALQAAGAFFGMDDGHRIEAFLGNFLRFLEDLLGANFETDVAPLAPFLVNMDMSNFFLFTSVVLQIVDLPSHFLGGFSPKIPWK